MKTLFPLIGMIIGLSPQIALACSCSRLSADELFRVTPIIFRGVMLEAHREEGSANRPASATNLIRVTERVRGSDIPDQATTLGVYGTSCGAVAFPVGETIIFLGDFQPARALWPAAFVTGTCTMALYRQHREAFDAIAIQNAAERGRLAAAARRRAPTAQAALALARFGEEWQDVDLLIGNQTLIARHRQAVPAFANLARTLVRRQTRQADVIRLLSAAVTVAPQNHELARLLAIQRLGAGDLGSLSSRRDFREVVTYGIDMSGRDLRGFDFSLGRLSGVTLRNADLRGAHLVRTLFDGDLSDTDLRGANLTTARINLPSLLRRARLDGVRAHGASLGADLTDASLVGIDASDANFSASILTGARLDGGRFMRSQFLWSDARNTDFADADLSEATFTCALLTNADLSRARLTGTRFQSAVIDDRTRFPDGFDPVAAGLTSERGKACPTNNDPRRPTR